MINERALLNITGVMVFIACILTSPFSSAQTEFEKKGFRLKGIDKTSEIKSVYENKTYDVKVRTIEVYKDNLNISSIIAKDGEENYVDGLDRFYLPYDFVSGTGANKKILKVQHSDIKLFLNDKEIEHTLVEDPENRELYIRAKDDLVLNKGIYKLKAVNTDYYTFPEHIHMNGNFLTTKYICDSVYVDKEIEHLSLTLIIPENTIAKRFYYSSKVESHGNNSSFNFAHTSSDDFNIVTGNNKYSLTYKKPIKCGQSLTIETTIDTVELIDPITNKKVSMHFE